MAADDDDLIMSKGDILNEMGRHDEAIKILDSFIDKNPEFGYGYYRRGWFKDEKGDREGAVDDYTMAIALDPTYAYSYIGRGRDYEILGQRELARADYLKVIELDTVPDDNSCAQYAYLFLGEKDKAIDFMNRYLENSDSKTGGTYDAACLYSLMGDTGKALDYLEQALERGYRRFAHMEVDRDLNNIRSTAEYKRLIEKYQKIQEQENEPIDNDKSAALSYSKIEEIIEIPFTKDRGVTKVKCTINELPLHFVFDTGASDVTMSMVEATFMLKNDYLSPDDFVGTAKYVDANGDVAEGAVINLRHVNFGGVELTNVRASVVRNQKAPLLLGQSVLGRLGKIEIDNSEMKLRITQK
ncbi:MAG: retroviral-like aspartic protease family protein [Muribaculum sp.]|nr:retroviral-like aspartic protease family protein [Muribaculum sp.]